MSMNNALTWKWLAAILTTVVLAGGSAWMGSMTAEVNQLKVEQKADRQVIQDVKGDSAVIRERTKRTEEDIKEIKETQKDQNRKLDELLRRTR